MFNRSIIFTLILPFVRRTLLVSGVVTWGSLIGYKVVTGYFELALSSMTFILGAILFAIAITLPIKAIFGKKSPK